MEFQPPLLKGRKQGLAQVKVKGGYEIASSSHRHRGAKLSETTRKEATPVSQPAVLFQQMSLGSSSALCRSPTTRLA